MSKDLILNMEIWAKTSNEFVTLDIETTGLHPDKGGRIIEIGAVKIRDGKLIDTFEVLINPEMPIPKSSTKIHGITDSMVIGAPTFREVLPDFNNFIGDSLIVAHNAMFDWDRFLLAYFKKVGIYPTNRVVDTLKLARKYYPKNNGGHSLGVLCTKLDIKLENAHRASDDALATARLFYYLKKHIIITEGENQLSLIPDESIHIKKQEVRKVNYWKKELSKGKVMQRIYVTLDRGNVFYDIPSRAWEVKASNEPIDFDDIEKQVVTFLNLKNANELHTHFN